MTSTWSLYSLKISSTTILTFKILHFFSSKLSSPSWKSKHCYNCVSYVLRRIQIINGKHSVAYECLCYINFYRDSFNQDNLKKFVINFFTADEILADKNVFWANVNELGDKQMLRDSNFRMHQDVDLSDFFATFKIFWWK